MAANALATFWPATTPIPAAQDASNIRAKLAPTDPIAAIPIAERR